MSYVDGFVIAEPKAKVETYKEMARTAGSVWKEHGALAYVETLGDDVPKGELTSLPRAVQATMRSWCFPGSSTPTANRATRSWPR